MRLTAVAAIVAAILLSATASAAAPSPAEPWRGRAADSLIARAEGLLRRNTFDTRRLAIHELEQATLLRPGDAAAELMLARAYHQAGYLKSARQRYERVTRMDPQDAGARYGLGQVWRRDWLKYLDPRSLVRAVQNLSAAARAQPRAVEAWLSLVPLLMEQQDLRAAASAAARAAEAAPDRPECDLALAYTGYRRGQVEAAERAFARAVPRLPRMVRERFDDIAPVATERDTFELHRLPAERQPEFIRRFWSEHDPDPTSAVNEAQLEYWSRVTHAFFLYYDARRREWDERGEVYVRYGAPAEAVYNPVGVNTVEDAFPMNVLVWSYPELGMRVRMEDRLLSEYYLLPMRTESDPDPRPDPDSLARLGGTLASAGGRGVFPVFPPGVEAMPVDGLVARFEGAAGPRLLAQVQVAAAPRELLQAEWAVFDTAGHEVTRARRALSPSACAPEAARVAEFAADLPPGRYRVGLSVSDGGRRRGVHRQSVTLEAPGSTLALSDVVITCGGPEPGAGPAVRITPDPDGHVAAGAALTAYFEAYRLTPDEDRLSRFEYVYTVRSRARDERVWLKRAFAPRNTPAPILATREEAFAGDVRRQFVSVPLGDLPPGPYRLEIQVRDLVSDRIARGWADFTRDASTAAAR